MGPFDEAVSMYNDVINIAAHRTPPDPILLYAMSGLADTYSFYSDLEHAIKLQSEVLALTKQNFGAESRDALREMAHLANKFFMAGHYDESRKLFEEVFRIRKQNQGEDHRETLASAWDLADTYYDLGRLDDAEHLIRQTISLARSKLGPHHQDVLNELPLLGKILLSEGKYSDAEAAYREVIDADPKNIRRYIEWAEALLTNGRCADAEAVYREAIGVNPQDPLNKHMYMQWEDDLLKNGRYANAEAVCREAIDAYPNFYDTRINLGEALIKQGKFDEAMSTFREGISRKPASQHLLGGLAELLANCPDPRLRNVLEALEIAQKLVADGPKAGFAWQIMGQVQYRAGQWQASIESLEKSNHLPPDKEGGHGYAGNWFYLAMAHWQLGNKDEARRWYDRAVEWTSRQRPPDADLIQFRKEAAALLGLPAPM